MLELNNKGISIVTQKHIHEAVINHHTSYNRVIREIPNSKLHKESLDPPEWNSELSDMMLRALPDNPVVEPGPPLVAGLAPVVGDGVGDCLGHPPVAGVGREGAEQHGHEQNGGIHIACKTMPWRRVLVDGCYG